MSGTPRKNFSRADFDTCMLSLSFVRRVSATLAILICETYYCLKCSRRQPTYPKTTERVPYQLVRRTTTSSGVPLGRCFRPRATRQILDDQGKSIKGCWCVLDYKFNFHARLHSYSTPQLHGKSRWYDVLTHPIILAHVPYLACKHTE